MRIARVVGNVVSTIKDDGLSGYKLLLVEYLSPATFEPEGNRQIAIDCVDAGIGNIVLVNTDGGAGNILLGDKYVIIDQTVCGIIDSYTAYGKETITRHDPRRQETMLER